MNNNVEHKKILGKYEVVEQLSKDEFKAQALQVPFIIKCIPKQAANEAIYSHLAQDISTIIHKNLINIKIDEDDLYFYAIREWLERLV